MNEFINLVVCLKKCTLKEEYIIGKKTLNNFKSIFLIIIIGIALIDLFMQLKFTSDKYKNIYIYIISITIVIFIYKKFKKWVISKKLLNSWYMLPKNFNKRTYTILIVSAVTIHSLLINLFPTQTENQKMNEKEQKNLDFITKILDGAVSPAIIEEICFRGILYFIIMVSTSILINVNRKNKYVGMIIFFVFSSILFSSLHVVGFEDFENIGGYLVSGIILSLVYVLTRSLTVSVMVHLLGNVFVLLNQNDAENILTLLWIINLIVVVSNWNVIRGYRRYVNYKIKKSKKQKILDAEKRSDLQ